MRAAWPHTMHGRWNACSSRALGSMRLPDMTVRLCMGLLTTFPPGFLMLPLRFLEFFPYVAFLTHHLLALFACSAGMYGNSVCLFVCLFVRVPVCLYAFTHAGMQVHACMYVTVCVECMHACMHARMDGWMDGWMEIYDVICTHCVHIYGVYMYVIM